MHDNLTMKMLASLAQLDHQVFFLLNHMSSWEPLRVAAESLSEFGRYAVILAVSIILALDGYACFRRRALAFLLVMPLALGLNVGLKQVVHRPRPMGYYHDAVEKGKVVILAEQRLTRKSFPSGHATLAFFALGYLAFLRPRHAGWALTLALLIAWSRVAVGAHYLSDCLAGAAIGLTWALLAFKIYGFIEQKRDENERV